MPHMNFDLPTTTTTAAATVTPVTAGRRISRALRWMFAAIGQQYTCWQDIKTLEGLDDRTLQDIGLHRSEVEAARQSFRFDAKRDL